jgi:hypothetical protein
MEFGTLNKFWKEGGDLESVIKIAILLVNSESGTYFFHQFDGQVNQ